MPRDALFVCLSSVDWDFNRQNPHEMALAFAARGHRVLFVENTGVRRVAFRDVPRLWRRLQNWWIARGGLSHPSEGVDVLSPVLFPFPYARVVLWFNQRWLVSSIRRWLKHKSGPIIVVTFLPTPLACEVIKSIAPGLVVYYCIDRFAESSPAARKIVTSERDLLMQADLVLVTSPALYEMASEIRKEVHLLPSGVRIDAFERARQTQAQRRARHPVLRPIVGFIGSLRHAIDISLLTEIADLAPDLQFVIGGPRFVDLEQLSRRPNVRLLEQVPHDDAIDHMVRFDVGVLPYSLNKFTAGIMPIKLKEFLAAGLPVVSTPLPAVRSFAEQYPGTVSFARDANEFVAELRKAIADVHPEAARHRVAIARKYDWTAQMSRMMELIDKALDGMPGQPVSPSPMRESDRTP
jgi:glycosyltransferase involved in cell wall biosynthesis